MSVLLSGALRARRERSVRHASAHIPKIFNVFDMSWVAVAIAAYITGFLVFWRLCRTAPEMSEKYSDHQSSKLEVAEQPYQNLAQEADPRGRHEKHAEQDRDWTRPRG